MLIWQKMLVVEAVSGSASFPDTEMQRLEGCQQLDVEKKREVFIIRGILEKETTKKSVFIIKKSSLYSKISSLNFATLGCLRRILE